MEGREGEERMENVENFRYLGRPIYQTDDDWLAVRRKIMRARSVWGRLGTLFLRKGEDPKVLASFYRAVVQAIILYGSETWVLLASMAKKVEVTHTEFLRLVTGKLVR